MAHSGHFATEFQCPLLGVKRTLILVQKKLKLRNARASILFVFGPLFRGVPHLTKYIERKERHPLLLVELRVLYSGSQAPASFLRSAER